MDPAAINMMNEGSFANRHTDTASYNLAEIWQFPMNGGAGLGESGGGLGLRGPQFGQNLGQFGGFTSGPTPYVPGNDPNCSEQGANGVNKKKRDSEDELAKGVSTSSNGGISNSNGVVNDGDGKRLKVSDNRNESRESKDETETSSEKPAEQSTEPASEPPKPAYIHVRARRGQATDSHSLAERARREKISERMKILQELVPGCNKVTGKALVLDEIINYIQSLQHQVEFLSMKLEAVNSRVNPCIEIFPPKDFGQQTFDMVIGSQVPRDQFSRGSSPEWLHMQVGGGFERTA